MRLTKVQLQGYLKFVSDHLDNYSNEIEYEIGLELIPIAVDVNTYLTHVASLERFFQCQEELKQNQTKVEETEEQGTTSSEI